MRTKPPAEADLTVGLAQHPLSAELSCWKAATRRPGGALARRVRA